MVGINIILSVGNEYVKLAWEFTGKPWLENRYFLHLKKFETIQICKVIMGIHRQAMAGVMGFLTLEEI